MPTVKKMLARMIAAMGVEDLRIPTSLVKFYPEGEEVPAHVLENHPDSLTFTSCQAVRQASCGDAVCLTRSNIGCVAAAISLGLVDQDETKPLEGPRVYTELMREQRRDPGARFQAPSPSDFTDGIVYACRDAGREDFCLFGEDDCGRYKDVATAKTAIADMTAIQPAVMQAVFFYTPEYDATDLIPDVVVFSVRPVELTRIIQAYQFNTGKRITASMGGIRTVNSDLVARPYLTGEMNISTYCLGARLIAKFEADRLGIGMPYAVFEEVVRGMEDSKHGFPFHLYPGAGT